MAFYNFISNITNWFWGIPVVLVLIGGGFFLTFQIRGIQFRKFGVIWKKTFGSLFDKEAQKKRLETTGVTPLAAAWSALGCTIGTGNIVGAATAIALGGPGALFWMWLSALAAMAVKYGEAVLSIRYREKRVDGYFGGLYMYIKNGLNNKALAGITAVIMLVAGTIVAGSHGASIKGSFVQMGMPSISAVVVCGIFVLAVLIFGTRGLNKITGVMIPFSMIVEFSEISALTVIWRTQLAPCISPYVPIYLGALDVPENYHFHDAEISKQTHFSPSESEFRYNPHYAYWAFKTLQWMTELDYGFCHVILEKEIPEMESNWQAEQDEVRQTLLHFHDTDRAVQYLTAYTKQCETDVWLWVLEMVQKIGEKKYSENISTSLECVSGGATFRADYTL